MIGKNRAAGLDRVLFGQGIKSPGIPGGLGTFDNEGRRVFVKLVGMRPDPAVLCFLEYKGKRIVELVYFVRTMKN